MTASVIEARPEHIIAICERLREPTKALLHSVGEAGHKALMQDFAKSIVAYTGLWNDEVACIWGVQCSPFADTGYCWLLTTTLLEEHPLIFLKHSRRVWHELLVNFKALYGYVIVDFDKSVLWLTWLGCRFEEPFEVNGKLIRKFICERA